MKNLIFDVESDGLYGKGFAFGYVIINNKNEVIEADSYISIEGTNNIKDEWVKNNVLPIYCLKKVTNNIKLRDKFYEILQKNKDCEVWSDVNYPVETNFLADIVRDDASRAFSMPYPLKDISTIIDANISREDNFNAVSNKKLIAHNPLNDALASAFILTKSIKIVEYYNK